MGLRLFKVLKSNPETKDIPVITLTSYAMEEDRERFMREEFDGYILKPINVKDFSEEVKKYIHP